VAAGALILILLGTAGLLYVLMPPEPDGSSGSEASTPTRSVVALFTNTLTALNTPAVVAQEPATSTRQVLTPSATSTSEPTPTKTVTTTPTATTAPTVTPDRGPEEIVIGRSVENRPIEAVRFGNGPNNIILIGGLHAGFAPATVDLANRAIAHYRQNLDEIPDSITLIIIISANPDSPRDPGELEGRLNANDVDLNRNWGCRWVANAKWRGDVIPGSGGTGPFSEPETKSLSDFIMEREPVAVVFWEALARDGLVSPGRCFERTRASASLAGTYGPAAGYPVDDFEDLTNQELNGDGTNWLDEQGIPAIAVLLPDYVSVDWPAHLAGIQALLQAHAD
jgi:eukaryotic-like serine/threonine-protein kinase